MLFWTVILLLAAGVALWIVIHTRIRFLDREFPSLDSDSVVPDPADGWPFVSVIVPARNEERDVGACLASLVGQDYPDFEILFVDDESTDRTLEIAQSALAGRPNARVIRGGPRPSGTWVGKSWALVQGAGKARADWLLFIDSDVVHHPKALRKAMALALQQRADAMSIMPAIDCHSFWEKIIMPLFALLSGLIAPLDRANHPDKRGSRLSGAFILIRRPVYEAVGGHRSVSDQILEDMALALRLKKQGASLWLTYTHDLTRTRMYDNFHDLWMGLSRLSFPMMNYSPGLLLVAYAAALAGTLSPWLGIAYGLFRVVVWGRPDGWVFAGLSLAFLVYITYVLKRVFAILREPRVFGWFLALAAHIYCFAATYSAFRHFTGKGLGWKQRVFPTEKMT